MTLAGKRSSVPGVLGLNGVAMFRGVTGCVLLPRWFGLVGVYDLAKAWADSFSSADAAAAVRRVGGCGGGGGDGDDGVSERGETL